MKKQSGMKPDLSGLLCSGKTARTLNVNTRQIASNRCEETRRLSGFRVSSLNQINETLENHFRHQRFICSSNIWGPPQLPLDVVAPLRVSWSTHLAVEGRLLFNAAAASFAER
jgi:hypothetical protein